MRDTTEAADARRATEAAIEALVDGLRAEIDVPAAARDLTIGQLRLLIAIRRAGVLSMRRVAHCFGVSQTAATGLVHRVERQGFVERRHRSDDRRVVECHLTDDGTQLLDDLTGVRARGIREALLRLSDEQLAQLEALLRAISTARAGDADSATSAAARLPERS